LSDFQKEIIRQINETLYRQIAKEEIEKKDQTLSDMLFYALGMDSDGTVHAGGKRIRPLICCLTCGAISGSHEPALLPGIVLEMFHNFTLIHDDIEDLGETRHGQPAMWKKWGSALSLNAGDMLFALTYKTLHEISGRSKTGSEISVFDQMVTDLIVGQHLDISFEKRQSITEEEYLTMISGKTVALIKGSFTLGAIAAEANQSTIAELEKVGEKIGLAFQMQDDYLGIWGDSNHLGKSVSTDITDKKKSLPIQYAMNHDASFNKEWQEYNGDPERVGYFADRLREIGADSYTRNQWERAMSEASKKMKSFSFNEKYGNELNELIGTLAGRNK